MKEDEFVKIAMVAAQAVLGDGLEVRRGESLLYEVTVDNRLELTVDPKRPRRGRSALQTDLAVFETTSEGVRLPRVVIELKKALTTHDVITYSAKAKRHKQVYPYLRYGLIVRGLRTIPGRFFTHNDGLDFAVAAAGFHEERLRELLSRLLTAEIEASRRLESIAFGGTAGFLFRTEVQVEHHLT